MTTLHKELKVSDFQILSKNWDKRTVDLIIAENGGGDMFGGGGTGIHVTVHGENSIKETGTVTLKGTYTYSYNIARGGNGTNSGRIAYFKPEDSDPEFTINVEGKAAVPDETLASILQAKKDFFI